MRDAPEHPVTGVVSRQVVNRRPKRDISESDKPRGEQKEEDSEAVIDLVTPPSTPTVSKERQKEEEDGIAFISKRKCNKVREQIITKEAEKELKAYC